MYDEEGGGGREKMLLSMWPLSGCAECHALEVRPHGQLVPRGMSVRNWPIKELAYQYTSSGYSDQNRCVQFTISNYSYRELASPPSKYKNMHALVPS